MKKRIIAVVAVVLVVAMLSVVLVACGAPKSIADAKEKLEGKGYTVTGGGAEYGNITFSKTVDDETVLANATFFKTADEAKSFAEKTNNEYASAKETAQSAVDAMKERVDSMEDGKIKDHLMIELKDLEKTLKKAANKAVKQNGQWVAFGSKKAVNDLF